MTKENFVRLILLILIKNSILNTLPEKAFDLKPFKINDATNIISLFNQNIITLELSALSVNKNNINSANYTNKLYYMSSLSIQNNNGNKTIILNKSIGFDKNNDYIILPKNIFYSFSSFLNSCQCELSSNIFTIQNFNGIICYNISNLPNIIINLQNNNKIIFNNNSYIKASIKNNKKIYIPKIIITDYNSKKNKNKKIILSESSSENYPIKGWIVFLIVLGLVFLIAAIIILTICFYICDQERKQGISMNNNYNNFNNYNNKNNLYSPNNVRNIKRISKKNYEPEDDDEQYEDNKNQNNNSQYNINENNENITSPRKSKIMNIKINKSNNIENDIPVNDNNIKTETSYIPNVVITNNYSTDDVENKRQLDNMNNQINKNNNSRIIYKEGYPPMFNNVYPVNDLNDKNASVNVQRYYTNNPRQIPTNSNLYNYYQNNRNIELRPMQP